MPIDFSGVRYIVNGEPSDQSVFNRPVKDLKEAIEKGLATHYYTKEEIDAISADDALINAIIFGG